MPNFGVIITINGENDVDLIDVSVSGGTVTITDTGPGGITTAAGPCTAVPPDTVTCPTEIGRLESRAGPGDLELDGGDSFVNQNLDVPVDLRRPGDGNDFVRSGPADDFIDDSLGDDVEYGEAGDDILDGTSGNTDTGADLLDGGPGGDEVDYWRPPPTSGSG